MKKTQLFMLHYAGGNAYSFQFMKPLLSAYDVVAVELPGRGKRMKEPLIKDYWQAVEDLYQQIKSKRTDADFILYGHSMGARLGLSIARKFEDEHTPPAILFVTGNASPKAEADEPDRHMLPHNEFVESLLELGGLPKELIEDQELFAFFEPMLRADFELLEKEKTQPHDPINTPIYAVMGSEETSLEHIDGWRNYTTSSFKHQVWPGNHFFIQDHAEALSKLLTAGRGSLLAHPS